MFLKLALIEKLCGNSIYIRFGRESQATVAQCSQTFYLNHAIKNFIRYLSIAHKIKIFDKYNKEP